MSNLQVNDTQKKSFEQKKLSKKWFWFRIWLYLLGGAALAIVIPNVILGFSQPRSKRGDCSSGAIYVSAMSRSQQVYYLEKNTFAKDITNLELGIQKEDPQFKYEIQSPGYKSFVYHYAIPKDDQHRSYVGAAAVIQLPKTKEFTTISISCRSVKPLGAGKKLPNPLIEEDKLICPEGTEEW